MPTHTWPPPGVRLSWRDGGEVVKRPLKRTEGGGHWPNNWLTLFLGPTRAPVSLCLGVPGGFV